jgi:pyruvate dehydrogenase E1 component beta subunit
MLPPSAPHARRRVRNVRVPELSYREAVRDALAQAMRKDDDVFVMGEDIAEMGGSMGVTQGLLDEFGPERIRNTPISEMAIVGAGIGAAMQGMRPVVEIMYEDFLTLSLEQIVNQAAKHRYMSGGQLKVPLTVRTQGGAGWSPGAQHAQQLEGWLVHVPGLKVVFASTPADVRGLLWSSIYDDNPVIFFEHRTLYGLKEDVPDELEPIPLGKARVHREGSDVTVIATGRLVHEALGAAVEAEKEGVSVEVVDPRTLQPLDEDALVESVKKTTRCVVAHEAVTRMGFGAEVASVVQYGAFDYLDAPIERVGAKFTPLPFAPVMEEFVVPHMDDVLQAIRRTVGRRGD